MRQITALYAGSFDPLTNGHFDLIQRGARTFDKLVVGVIGNPQKKPFFTQEERVDMIRRQCADLPNVEVTSFTGLLADFVNRMDYDVVLRGLRGNTDFESEIQMAQINATLYKEDVETVFLMTDPRYSFLSSSMAKEVHSLGGSIKGLVPDLILEEMDKKLQESK